MPKKKPPPTAQREHFLVGVLGKVPLKDRTRVYFVSIFLAAGVVLICMYLAPTATSLGVPTLGIANWIRRLAGK